MALNADGTRGLPATTSAGSKLMAHRILLAAALLAVTALPACGSGKKLTADSSCRDYASASAQKREAAVNKLAMDLNAPKAAGLGQPNVDNACIRQPDATLGTVVSRYRPADEAPHVSSAEDGVQELTLDQALARLRGQTAFTPPDETSGFQLPSVGWGNGVTVRDAAVAELTKASQQGHVLPDGVTMDMFSQLLGKALVTVKPSQEYGLPVKCSKCERRISTPDHVLRYENWTVTFPPKGRSRADYFEKVKADDGVS
jgi:outer membrane murein-binding lipoprotein Lpp